MTLPINRTPLTAFSTNAAPENVFASSTAEAAMQEAYDTIDELNSKVDTHSTAATLAHPDGSVTGPKIRDGAVGTTKLADGSITYTKLGDGSVTNSKLAGSITGDKLTDGTIATAKYADRSITGQKIALGAITSEHIGTGATSETVNGVRIDGVVAQLADIAINVKDKGADPTGATSSLAVVQSIVNSISKGIIYFPTGSFDVGGLTIPGDKQIVLVGAGVGKTFLLGNGVDVITLTDPSGTIDHVPYFGISKMTIGGTASGFCNKALNLDAYMDLTTILRDIALQNCTSDGLWMRGYTNCIIEKVRFDQIGGYGINITAPKQGLANFVLKDFTYDNGSSLPAPYNTQTTFGSGLLYVNLTTLNTANIGNVAIENGRIEVNYPIGTASLFYFNQNASFFPVRGISMDNITVDVKTSPDCTRQERLIGSNKQIQVRMSNISAYNIHVVQEIDNYSDGYTIPCGRLKNIYIPQSHLVDNGYNSGDFVNLPGTHIRIRSATAKPTFGSVKRGDLIINSNPFSVKVAGWQVDTQYDGMGRIDAPTATTGAITTGTNTLVVADKTLIHAGFAVKVVGAGASGADLYAVANYVDYATNTIYLNANASTTVSGASVSQAQFSVTPFGEYKLSGATASRPTTGRYDGLQYYDTTLNKPVWWNATANAWKDATGTNA